MVGVCCLAGAAAAERLLLASVAAWRTRSLWVCSVHSVSVLTALAGMSTTQKPGGFEDTEFEKAAVSIDLPPSFDTVSEEREYRKIRLAGALRIIGSLGFAEGVAGHITARDPEHTDHFWVNPFGKSFRQMTVSDLILVNPDGDVVQGTKPVNAAAYAIHHAIHTARPEVVCAVHTHTIYGKAFAATNLDLKMLSQDACMFHNDWVRHREGGGAIVVGRRTRPGWRRRSSERRRSFIRTTD